MFVFHSIAMAQKALLRYRELCHSLLVVFVEKVEAASVDLNEEVRMELARSDFTGLASASNTSWVSSGTTTKSNRRLGG